MLRAWRENVKCFDLSTHTVVVQIQLSLGSTEKSGSRTLRIPKSVIENGIQFSSVAQSCPTLCNPLDCSTPVFPVHHQLPELVQTPIHRAGDGIQPFHPLSSPSQPAFNLSQHRDLFQCVSSSHQMAKVLEFQLQY